LERTHFVAVVLSVDLRAIHHFAGFSHCLVNHNKSCLLAIAVVLSVDLRVNHHSAGCIILLSGQ
jgi:hypothetical protein